LNQSAIIIASMLGRTIACAPGLTVPNVLQGLVLLFLTASTLCRTYPGSKNFFAAAQTGTRQPLRLAQKTVI
jgi:hypothetical protein